VPVCFLAGLVAAAVAQTNAPATRALSLQDCLAEALQHNFDVRVERFEPVKSQISLSAAYAGYDPTSTFPAATPTTCPDYVSPYSTNPVPATVSDENSFNSDLGGLLPWGLHYDFSGGISESYGSQAGSPFDNSRGSMGLTTLKQPLLKNFGLIKRD